MSDEYETSMSIPLDKDGFLRRECPTCELEFKVFVQQNDGGKTDEQSPAPGGYFCPYCAIQADPNSWFTEAQLEVARSKIMDEVVGPMLADFKRDVERAPGVSVNLDKSDDLVPELTESDDMRRANFTCHPDTPVKVADDHNGSVHCFICGGLAEPSGQAPAG